MNVTSTADRALRLVAIAMAAAFLCVLLIGRNASAATTKVACVGDSITAGSMASAPAHAYPAVLGTLAGAGWDVQNFGNSGKTMIKMPSDGLSYWNQTEFSKSQSFAPDIVTLMLGTNDSKTKNWNNGTNTFEADYRSMVSVYLALPSHPRLFLMLPPPALSASYAIDGAVIQNQIIPMIRRIAADNGLEIIDINAAIANNQPKTLLSSDGIHPNDAGYQLIAQTVWNAIKAAPVPPTDAGVADSGTLGRDASVRVDSGSIDAEAAADVSAVDSSPDDVDATSTPADSAAAADAATELSDQAASGADDASPAIGAPADASPRGWMDASSAPPSSSSEPVQAADPGRSGSTGSGCRVAAGRGAPYDTPFVAISFLAWAAVSRRARRTRRTCGLPAAQAASAGAANLRSLRMPQVEGSNNS